MISIKRYWDSQGAPGRAELLTAVVTAYRSALSAFGVSAAQACPPAAASLQRTLDGVGQELSEDSDAAAVAGLDERVAQALQTWGTSAQTSVQQRTNDVKELLVVMTRTAAAFAASDVRYARRFDDFTVRLQRMANLEDLGELRATIVRTAADLKTHVEQMSMTTRESVAQLQAEVATYQARLEEVEQLASRDELTGLFKRSRVESHIEHRMAAGRAFCVVMIDMNGFKQINDTWGHKAGDDLLKQFAADLRSNTRPGDIIGRWGGDEFLAVFDGSRAAAMAQVERIEQWVLGDYTIEGFSGRQKVRMQASIGLAEWRPGLGLRELIEQADAAMYREKDARRAS